MICVHVKVCNHIVKMYHIVMLKRKTHFAITDKPQFQMSEQRINGGLSKEGRYRTSLSGITGGFIVESLLFQNSKKPYGISQNVCITKYKTLVFSRILNSNLSQCFKSMKIFFKTIFTLLHMYQPIVYRESLVILKIYRM